MARSGGAPAGVGGMSLTEYLDGPDALHRRAASSLSIVRSAAPRDGPRVVDGPGRDDRRTQSSRRASLSSWRSAGGGETTTNVVDFMTKKGSTTEKASSWRSWRPVRALSHLRMRRAGCLFSVEVSAARGLPASMERHRLAVTVRKAESPRDGAVQTMPARVRDGAADFDETLFVRCNLYFTGGRGTGKPLRLEPRRFVVSVVAVEARGVPSLGAHAVDVTALVLESVRKSSDGRRVRWFDATFPLSGKASGGELVLRLGFQLMEDAGLSLYTQAAGEATDVPPTPPPAGGRARAHNRDSFSISSSSTPSRFPASPVRQTTSQDQAVVSPSTRAYKQLVDRLRVDDVHGDRSTPVVASRDQKQPRGGGDEKKVSASSSVTGGDVLSSLPEYEVVEKGVEAVKEVVHYQPHRDVLRELDSIAEQIEAIEALMTNKSPKAAADADDQQQQRLEADEEMVTVEFLRKLEAAADDDRKKLKQPVTPRGTQSQSPRKPESPPVVPDLGPSLGPAVQTRDGGFLVSMNPFDVPLASRDGPPKLAMQVSRPFVLPGALAATGFDVLHNMAAAAGGAEAVRDRLASLGGMDNLKGKAPAQVGFEGIAEAVIGGRRTEGGANSSAARSVQLVRKLADALSAGRSQRVDTGIWTAGNDPETLEEVLAFSLQKLEAMAVDALAIQAEMADEDAPFEVGAAAGETSVFDALVPYDEWPESSASSDGRVTLVAAVQLRDPSRRYEAVGAPMVAVVQSARLLGAGGGAGGRFKVRSLHVGGVQTRYPSVSSGTGGGGGTATSWDAERQKLTAMQWMIAHGPSTARAAGRRPTPRARRQRPDVIWSLSSRVLAGMWLKTVRNPDVRISATSGRCEVCDPPPPQTTTN